MSELADRIRRSEDVRAALKSAYEAMFDRSCMKEIGRGRVFRELLDIGTEPAFIAAALMLVPEGWQVFHLFNARRWDETTIWECDLAPDVGAVPYRGRADHASLAIASAALRSEALG